MRRRERCKRRLRPSVRGAPGRLRQWIWCTKLGRGWIEPGRCHTKIRVGLGRTPLADLPVEPWRVYGDRAFDLLAQRLWDYNQGALSRVAAPRWQRVGASGYWSLGSCAPKSTTSTRCSAPARRRSGGASKTTAWSPMTSNTCCSRTCTRTTSPTWSCSRRRASTYSTRRPATP